MTVVSDYVYVRIFLFIKQLLAIYFKAEEEETLKKKHLKCNKRKRIILLR